MTKLESILNGFILIIFIFFSTTLLISKDLNYAISQIATMLLVIVIYYGLTLKIIPPILIEKKRKNWYNIIVVFIIGLILLEVLYGYSLSIKYYQKYYRLSSLFDCLFYEKYGTVNHYKIISILLTTFVFSFFWSFLKIRKSKKINTFKISILGFILIIFTIWFCSENYINQSNFDFESYEYNLNEKQIHVITDEDFLFEDIEKLSSDTEKSKYIIFWTTACTTTPALIELEKLKNDSICSTVEFIYIHVENKRYKNDLKLWKHTISDNNIKGLHLYLNSKATHNILIDKLGITDGIRGAKSILCDRNGAIININAPRPKSFFGEKDNKDLLLLFNELN